MQKNTTNSNSNTHFGVLGYPGGASGEQNLQGGVVGHFPPPMKFLKNFPDYVWVIRTYWGGLWEWFLTSPHYPPTLILLIIWIVTNVSAFDNCFPIYRHDICQMFYTSTVSQILKFTREKARKSRHFRLLIWNFGNFIHIIWLTSQFSSIYAHFILNLWLKWLKIP